MMPPTRTREGIAGLYTRQDQDDVTYSDKGRYCRSLDRIKMMPPTRTREGIVGLYTRQDQHDATYSDKARYCRCLYTTGSR